MVHRILVVDDESSFLHGLTRALRRVCHFEGEIQTAENGREAIHEISGSHYDVCFLDINLPDISGIDVLKRIANVSPSTRVIIMTASEIDDAMKRAIERDAIMFLQKPIELDDIKAFLSGEVENGCDFAAGAQNHTAADLPIKERRAHERMACSKIVRYSISIFYDWELRSDLIANILDMSDGGVGITTGFPVVMGNVLRFDKNFHEKRGIVKWWSADPPKYRAGVKFL